MKQKKKRGKITLAVNILFVAAICFVGWRIADQLIQDRKSADLSENLWKKAVITAQPAAARPAETGAVPGTPAGEASTAGISPSEGDPAEEMTGTAAETPASVFPAAETKTTEALPEKRTQDPDPAGRAETDRPDRTAEKVQVAAEPEEEDPSVPAGMDFDALREINPDAAAWLYAPDIGVNNVVMYPQNNDYYLNHLADGSVNRAGELFIDCRNAEGFADPNTIIYGHNMRNGTMFGNLRAYKDEAYCEEHPVMYLYIPGYRFRLDAAAAINTSDEAGYYRIPADREQWDKLLRRAMEKTAYDFGISPEEGDRYVTLSTCDYGFEGQRWILICRICDPEGILRETPEGDPAE